MTDQHTTKTTPPAESTLLSNQCNAYMYACFKFSTPKWVMISTISDTWSAETVQIFLNYVCTLFNKLPSKSSVFICLISIALSWITNSLLKIPVY